MTYLVNLTFHAGSDSSEDTDTGVYFFNCPAEMSYSDMTAAYEAVNESLNIRDYEISDHTERTPISLKFSYDDGCNIDTLNRGVAEYLNINITRCQSNMGPLPNIADYYEIELYQ